MKILVLVATALTLSCAYAQDSKPLSVTKVPLRADAPLLFAPKGWKIEKAIRGDLNRDKVADTALVLVEDKPAKAKDGDVTERLRALVVLAKTGKGWTRIGFNNSLLIGTRDGGAFWGFMETPVDVSIAKGVLAVHIETGSREMSERTWKFRYEAARKGLFLIGTEAIDHDRLTGAAETASTNYLSGVKIVSTYHEKSDSSTKVKSRVSRKLRALESVSDDE